MSRNYLLQKLSTYAVSKYVLPEENQTVQRFISFVQNNPFCFERSNYGHVTGSAWIVNSDFSKVLLTHHKKLNMWLQLGGHADGDTNIQAVALKEAQEESGIEHFNFLSEAIFDIDVHAMPNGCGYHYDVRFLLHAQSDDFSVSNESHDLAWVEHAKIQDYTNELSIIRMQKKYQLGFGQFAHSSNKL